MKKILCVMVYFRSWQAVEMMSRATTHLISRSNIIKGLHSSEKCKIARDREKQSLEFVDCRVLTEK